MSRFAKRLEASVYSLSSLRTIPIWRSTLSRAHKTYAIIECGHDSDSDTTPSPPHEFGGAASSSQRSSFGNDLWNNCLRTNAKTSVQGLQLMSFIVSVVGMP